MPTRRRGFAGSESDGLAQLDASHGLTPTFPDARDGNVVGTARVALNGSGKTVLALGFGATQGEAVGAAEGSLGAGFDGALASYGAGWAAYDATLTRPRTEKLPGVTVTQRKQLDAAYFLSANVLKASEDKTFPGAIVASLASPWGQAISAGDPANTYFGSYREVFSRDLYEAWTGLLADGDLATARDATLFLFERQQLPDGSMPRNSLVNGKTAPGFVRDAARRGGLPDPDGRPARADGRDAVQRATSSPPRTTSSRTARRSASERWEEQSGYSPSTIAAEIAGLVAAADLARANGDPASAAIWLGVADDMQRSIKSWTVTTNGPLSADPYFIRLSKSGDPNAAISYNVGNGGPDLDQRAVIDAGLPRARPAGRAATGRPGRGPLAGDRRRDDQDGDAERPRLASLQRRRLRRQRQRWPAVGAVGQGDRPSLAGAVGRASRTVARDRRRGRRHRRCCWACATSPRASGSSRSRTGSRRPIPASPYGTDPDDRLDRLHERPCRRLGVAAHLVGRVVRAADGRPRREAQRRAAGRDPGALRGAHARAPRA